MRAPRIYDDLTGLPFHQWLGVALGGLAAYHFSQHWAWARSVARSLTSQAMKRSRLYFLIDAAIALGLALIIVTGLAISSWLALPLGS